MKIGYDIYEKIICYKEEKFNSIIREKRNKWDFRINVDGCQLISYWINEGIEAIKIY